MHSKNIVCVLNDAQIQNLHRLASEPTKNLPESMLCWPKGVARFFVLLQTFFHLCEGLALSFPQGQTQPPAAPSAGSGETAPSVLRQALCLRLLVGLRLPACPISRATALQRQLPGLLVAYGRGHAHTTAPLTVPSLADLNPWRDDLFEPCSYQPTFYALHSTPCQAWHVFSHYPTKKWLVVGSGGACAWGPTGGPSRLNSRLNARPSHCALVIRIRAQRHILPATLVNDLIYANCGGRTLYMNCIALAWCNYALDFNRCQASILKPNGCETPSKSCVVYLGNIVPASGDLTSELLEANCGVSRHAWSRRFFTACTVLSLTQSSAGNV